MESEEISTDNRKTLIELKHKEAKYFLLKEQSYRTFDLPDYFKFRPLLKKLDKQFTSSNSNNNLDEAVKVLKQIERANYQLLSSKDGKYAWRPFELIHPLLYISLVSEITKEGYWEEIKSRFKEFQKNDKIQCCSLPVIPNSKVKKENETDETQKSAQISTWWEKIEQESISLALKYQYMMQTDITDCYGAIYTHSIPWAIHTKKTAKNEKWDNSLGNIIDRHLQAMNYGQTNGIPQGSILMDFIAEILLGYIDLELFKKLENEEGDYKILRYRDDYRIFSNDSIQLEKITKELSEILSGVGLRLNPGKTKFSDNVIKDTIKPDKRYWIANARKTENKQKWLIQLYLLSESFPNSGTLEKEMGKFLKFIGKDKRKDQNISDNVIKDTIKPDKRYWIANARKTENKQKWLIQLYLLSESFPNSGTLEKEMGKFLKFIGKDKRKDQNIKALISLVVEIAFRNPRVIATSILILAFLVKQIEDKQEKKDIINGIKAKFERRPNTSFLKIWLQRLSIKIFDSIEYDEPLCKKVASKYKKAFSEDNSNLWKMEELEKKMEELEKKLEKDKKTKEILENTIKIFENTPIICDKSLREMDELPSKKEIEKATIDKSHNY